MERARRAAAARHREEELDPAGRLRQRAARAGQGLREAHRRGLPDPAAADPDDHVRDHRGPDADGASGWASAASSASAIAVTIIGGQSLCLFLTLLLVPVAYVKLDVLEQASTTQRIKAWLGHAFASTVGRLRPARRDA